MNALQVFTYTDHPVRVIEVNGDPLYCQTHSNCTFVEEKQ